MLLHLLTAAFGTSETWRRLKPVKSPKAPTRLVRYDLKNFRFRQIGLIAAVGSRGRLIWADDTYGNCLLRNEE